MKDLAIYGAGGFGRETSWLIQQINQVQDQWNLLGFFDDGVIQGKLVDDLPVLGGLAELNTWGTSLDLVVAIADPQARGKLVSSISNKHVHFPLLIHPSANTGAIGNSFGKGSIITAGVILTTGIHLGDFVIVNLSSTIGHDVRIGKFSTLMPSCSISGNVAIDEGVLIGTGARTLQNLSIGKNAVVGAGAVVLESVEADTTVAGVPAKKISV